MCRPARKGTDAGRLAAIDAAATWAPRTAVIGNGLSLPYVEQGDPAAPPVLLLHGYTDSWRSFAGVLARLPGSVRAIALTQRGHGGAGRPAAGYRPRDFAADTAAFLDALGIDAAVIVGHSMGSAIAQRFALDHPRRVLGLVLVGAFASARGNAGLRAFWSESVSGLADPVSPAFALAFQRGTLARPVPQAFLDMVVRESLKVPARVWRAALAALLEVDHAAELPRITAPTLIVWGDRDAIFPRSDQEALLSAMPHARLLVYPGAGHSPHWEEPDRFAADLTAFVTEDVAALARQAPEESQR